MGDSFARVARVPALDAASAPGARCGHSLTACLSEGDKKLILFGGATALENSASGAAAGIRLAGATSDVHRFDLRTGSWTKLAPEGEAPSPRAAHAAAAVGRCGNLHRKSKLFADYENYASFTAWWLCKVALDLRVRPQLERVSPPRCPDASHRPRYRRLVCA